MRIIRGTFKALSFALGGAWMMIRIATMNLIKGPDLSRSLRYRLHFLRFLIPMLGVKVEDFGTPPKEAGLIMSNHRSYFDPIPVLRKVWAVAVGKAEVRKWPFIGLGGQLSGTVFVDRSTSDGRQAARDKINQRLTGGYSILIYPEGTIYPGPKLGELKMGMFKDAAKYGYLIHPVALEYRNPDDVWTHKDSFVKHFFRRFGGGPVEIRVSYGPSMQGDNAEELASRFKEWIQAEIKVLREGWYTAE